MINKYKINIHKFIDNHNFKKKYYDKLFLYFDYDLYLKDNFDIYFKLYAFGIKFKSYLKSYLF